MREIIILILLFVAMVLVACGCSTLPVVAPQTEVRGGGCNMSIYPPVTQLVKIESGFELK
jgi:hypothetical protein